MIKKVFLFLVLTIGATTFASEIDVVQNIVMDCQQTTTNDHGSNLFGFEGLSPDNVSILDIPDSEPDPITLCQKMDLLKEYIRFLLKEDFKSANEHLCAHQKEYAWATIATVSCIVGSYLFYKYITSPTEQPTPSNA